MLPYLYDFLLAPSRIGRASTSENCALARLRLEKLFDRLGLARHPNNGCWHGEQKLENLGVEQDTTSMNVRVSHDKVHRVRLFGAHVVTMAHRIRRLVPLSLLRHFCGVSLSLTLLIPLDLFYTRSLYCNTAQAELHWREDPKERGPILQLDELG